MISVESKTTFSMYRKFLFHVLRELKRGCFIEIHGSEIVNWSFDHYKGSPIAGNDVTEKVIRLLCELKILIPLNCCPTPSQRIFTGLNVSKRSYKHLTSSFETARTFETHFMFRVDSVPLRDFFTDSDYIIAEKTLIKFSL